MSTTNTTDPVAAWTLHKQRVLVPFDFSEASRKALLVGNNLANIGASALATGVLTAWFGDVGVLYATGVMSVLVIIFAEVLPKTVAINAPDRV